MHKLMFLEELMVQTLREVDRCWVAGLTEHHYLNNQ